jgi:transcriptional regulator with XRE-family HTH domain
MKEIKELLELIKAKREEKGISQREIADYLGISQPAYRNIEGGQTSLKVETLYQIAQYLGIDIFAQSKNQKEESLVAVNPNDIFKNMGDLKKGQDDLKNDVKKYQDETNRKLDEILEQFKKGNKKK